MEYTELLEKAYLQIPKKGKEEVRLEIPKAESLIQGSKTIIRNFVKLCEVIRRDPQLVMKYLSKEMATGATIDGERCILNTKVDNISLLKKLDQFYKTYVICKECGKIDTHLEDFERGFKILRCEACGARTSVAVKF